MASQSRYPVPLGTAFLAALRRPPAIAAATAGALLLVVLPWAAAVIANPAYVRWLIGIDRDIYASAAQSWLQSGQWYHPRQLAGPYDIVYGDVLYPPLLLYLLLPFQLLPTVLWWLLPAGATLASLRHIRPPAVALPFMLLCLAWPLAMEEVIKGNPVIWVLAAEAVAIAWGGPTTLVLLKPSLFPFAFIGVRDRKWWVVLGGMALASVPLLRLTLEYPVVVLNSRGGGLLYSIRDVPLLLIPVIAVVAARQGAASTSA